LNNYINFKFVCIAFTSTLNQARPMFENPCWPEYKAYIPKISRDSLWFKAWARAFQDLLSVACKLSIIDETCSNVFSDFKI